MTSPLHVSPSTELDADTVEALGLDSTGIDVPPGHTFPYTLQNLPLDDVLRLALGDRYYAEARVEIARRVMAGEF